MTTYRFVCPDCTTYISSYGLDSNDPSFWEDWREMYEEWYLQHVCGTDIGDGIEKPSEYARFEKDIWAS